MDNKRFIKFVLKALLLSSPFIAIFMLYIVTDPFKVLYSYNSYFPSHVALNKEFVSVQTFKKQYPKHQHDSYILGNSRSIFFEIDSWKKHIYAHECFHFDAANETLIGILEKLQYLESQKVYLKNVLIAMDYSTLRRTERPEERLFINHPEIVNGSKLYYQFLNFKSFINPSFLYIYLDYKLNNDSVKEYMIVKKILNKIEREYNPVTNEAKYTVIEQMIQKNPSDFYNAKKMEAFVRKKISVVDKTPIIADKQRAILNGIATILKRNNSNFRIIINPLYNQIKLHINDLNELQKIFGTAYVFDFSGKNAFTDNYLNYYEDSHFRPHVADSIMKVIYSN